MLSPQLLLSFTPEAPVAYEANNFSRNHIKQTPSSIDYKNDIIPLSSLPGPSPNRGEDGVEALLFSKEILFHGVLSVQNNYICMLKSVCVIRDFALRRSFHIIMRRQSTRQLHQSAMSVWKSLLHTQAHIHQLNLYVCWKKVGWQSSKGCNCADVQPRCSCSI